MRRHAAAAGAVALLTLCAVLWWWLDSGGESHFENEPPARPIASDAATGGSDLKSGTPHVGAAVESAEYTPRMLKLLSGAESPEKLQPAQIEAFLARHGRSALNLVAASQFAGDKQWLREALRLFPNDPLALQTALFDKELPPAERAELLTCLRAAAPDNPVTWLLSAQSHFATDKAAALADLQNALDRPAFYTYDRERIEAGILLYQSTGAEPLEADLLGQFGLHLPHLQVSQDIAKSLTALGTEQGELADATQRITYGLGRVFATPQASRTVIGQLVGFSMEKRVLSQLGGTQPEWLPVEPKARLQQIEKETEAIRQTLALTDSALTQPSEILREYLRKQRIEGEASALRWLAEHGRGGGGK